MNGARATKNISMVLVSSLLVFTGWSCGGFLRDGTEHHGVAGPGHAGGHYYGGGSRFFWWHSGYYSGGSNVGIGGGGGRPGAVSTSSVRGGFGTIGHSAGG
jgi:hypothetical protein